MKNFIYTLITLASGIMLYNLSMLNFDNLLMGESRIALIGVLAAASVIVLMIILLKSKEISKKIK